MNTDESWKILAGVAAAYVLISGKQAGEFSIKIRMF
jgi:hypothetical protein